MDNKKQKKQGLKDSKRSLGYPLAQSISLQKELYLIKIITIE